MKALALKALKVLKGFAIFLCVLVVLCLICALSAWAAWLHFTSALDLPDEAKSERIAVERGMTARQMAEALEQRGLLRSADLFCLALRLKVFSDEPFVLKSGFYEVKSSMSMEEIYELFASGRQEYVKLTVPEGLTMSKVAALLEESGVCGGDEFLTLCKDEVLLESYHIPSGSFEGYLFPDTYFFLPETAPDDVLALMVDNFFSKIDEIFCEPENGAEGNESDGREDESDEGSEDSGREEISPQRLHEIVILASIVEREYRIEEEAPLIASVFVNRLKDGIGLYSCATIEYILTEIQGKDHPSRITYEDLQVESPYNTYKWAGLPPGPISNPSLTALKAVIAPAKSDYYFFVLSDPSTGQHTFSQTFGEHKRAENSVLIPKGSASKGSAVK